METNTTGSSTGGCGIDNTSGSSGSSGGSVFPLWVRNSQSDEDPDNDTDMDILAALFSVASTSNATMNTQNTQDDGEM